MQSELLLDAPDWHELAEMTNNTICHGEELANGGAQSPDAVVPTLASLDRSPGGALSLTPICSPVPEQHVENNALHADSWSLCDLFSGQERPMCTSPCLRTGNGAPSGSINNMLAQEMLGTVSPEPPTFHPRPMRPHQPGLLDSEATSKPSSFDASSINKAPPKDPKVSMLVTELRYASTPSPERQDRGSNDAEWEKEVCMNSPNPIGAPRTPEPAHYYAGASICTPSPPHAYHQAYQHGCPVPLGSLGAPSWRVPSCPMPVGLPQGTCVGMSLPNPFSGSVEHCSETPATLLLSQGGAPATTEAQRVTSASSRPSSVAEAAKPVSVSSGTESTGAVPSDASEMRGQVAQLSKTQAGSKYLQRQLQKGQSGIVDIILHEVEQNIAHLMCDAYGNYLCSVAFQACSARQRKRMLEKLAPCVTAIACDKRGTHALQALIGLLSTREEQQLLTSAIQDHVIELCMDPNGTHVVQRLLYCFVPPCIDCIYFPVVSKLVEVAHHPYGLCVLKKCISHAKPLRKHQDLLLSGLAQHALDLVQSPYGNYAIQHALEEWGGARCTPIFHSLEGWMMQLSIQKFSSNVVEKLFCSAPPDFRARFIAELIENEKMSVLVNSNYGHYVVRRALELAEPPQVHLLLAAIRGNVGQLPNRRLRAKWERVMSVGTLMTMVV